MAINLCCPVCYKTYKLQTVKCSCGNNLRTNKRFKVRIKRPDGRWQSKQVNSLELAKKVEAKFKTQAVEKAIFDIHHAPLIDAVWEKYIKWARLNKRSWNDDRIRWSKHISPHLSGVKMDCIKPHHIQTLLEDMATKKSPKGKSYAPATVKQALILTKRVFNWAKEQGLYPGPNPCDSIKPPKFDNKVTNPLDRQGLKRLMNTLDSWGNERAVLPIKFALYSGKRKSEILNLKWADVNLSNATYTLSKTKSGKQQALPLNNLCKEIIHRAKELRISDYVFPSQSGGHYYECLSHTWRLIRKKAGLSIRFHDLRHTYASYLASSGKVDIYTLKELLGHSSIEMTQRYAHLINGALKRAACVADEVF